MSCMLLAVAALPSQWTGVLVDSAVKGTALLMLAAVASLMLRRDSAAARYLVWLLAIVAVLVVPALSSILPRWHALPQWAGVSPKVVALEASAPSTAALADDPVKSLESPRNPQPQEIQQTLTTANLPDGWHALKNEGRGGRIITPFQDVPPAADAPPATPFQGVPPAAESVSEADDSSWSWSGALPFVWAIGCCLVLLRLPAARWMLRRAEREATALSRSSQSAKMDQDPIATTLESVRLQLGIGRSPSVLIQPANTIPTVWGILRCRLLLPAAARHWSGEQLRSVLLHELAHVKRRDMIGQLLAQIACALYWFNPLAWLAAWRLGVERERACDDLVLSGGVRPSAYAEHLLDVATRLSPARWTRNCGLIMARKPSLEGRLAAMLSENLNRRGVSAARAAIALAITFAITVPIAMLRAAVGAEPSAPAQTEQEEPQQGDLQKIMEQILQAQGQKNDLLQQDDVRKLLKQSIEGMGQKKEEPQNSDLQTRLVPLDDHFTLGQPMRLRLELKNVGQTVAHYDPQGVDINGSLSVKDPQGNALRYVAGSVQTGGNKPALTPGNVVYLFDDLDLDSQYLIVKPGKYSVQFTGYGLPKSNTVEIEVRPGTLPPIKRIAARLLDVLPKNWQITVHGYSGESSRTRPADWDDSPPGWEPVRGLPTIELPENKRNDGFAHLWLSDRKLEWTGKVARPNEKAPLYLGKCPEGYVYANLPSYFQAETAGWPTFESDFRKAIKVEPEKTVDALAEKVKSDDDLKRLKGLSGRDSLSLDYTGITDAGLKFLEDSPQLKRLWLRGTGVTDQGLISLAKLPRLENMSLDGTKITDAGLEKLKGLTRLQYLSLCNTAITDAGLEAIKGFADLRWLDLAGTRISDAGLQSIKGLTKIERLSLANTRITDAGLEHLKGLTQLTSLNLEGAQVTDKGVARLQQGLPRCELFYTSEEERRVPKNLDEAHEQLLRILPVAELDRIRAMTDEKEMNDFHLGLGMWMRNNWELWKGGELAQSLNRLGLKHPDDMSGVILETFWCKLHGKPFRLEERVAFFEEYWRSMEKPKGGSPKDGGKIAWVITKGQGKGTTHLGISITDHSYWRYEYGSGRGIEPARTDELSAFDELLKTWNDLGTKLEVFANDKSEGSTP